MSHLQHPGRQEASSTLDLRQSAIADQLVTVLPMVSYKAILQNAYRAPPLPGLMGSCLLTRVGVAGLNTLVQVSLVNPSALHSSLPTP
jgi:hypothetical protein